jgi:hypothetical protein
VLKASSGEDICALLAGAGIVVVTMTTVVQ